MAGNWKHLCSEWGTENMGQHQKETVGLFDWSIDITVAALVQSNYPEYIIIWGDIGLFAWVTQQQKVLIQSNLTDGELT